MELWGRGVSGPGGGEGGEGREKPSGFMSGGKPVLVVTMYSPRACSRGGSVHRLASLPREETSFSRRSRTLARAGQDRMACRNVSGSISHRGHARLGSSSDQVGWAAR